MKVQQLKINNKNLLREDGTIDWFDVYNVPIVSITNNNHTHDDRYYRISEVNSRISSATTAIEDLIEKVDLLNETTGISLNSNDASISIPASNTSFSTAFTISVGVITPEPENASIIFNKEDSYELQISTSGYLSYAMHDDSSWAWIYTGIKISFNKRHIITFVYDGNNNKVLIYINGGLIYDSTINGSYLTNSPYDTPTSTVINIPSTLAINNNPLLFGLRSNNAEPLINGKFDTILIYNKALSSSEVKTILTVRENNISNISNLIAYYNFEGTSPLTDKSGNNITASTTGSVSYVVL